MSDQRKNKVLLRALRDLSHIQPATAASDQAIASARDAILSNTRSPSAHRRRATSRAFGALAATVVAITVLTQWLLPSDSGARFAFAEVQRQVERTKSVQYLQTRTDRAKDGQFLAKELRRAMVLGTHQVREEIKSVNSGAKDDAWAEGPADYVMIYNAKTGKALDLYPARKRFTIPREILAIDPNDEQVHVEKIEPAPNLDFYSRIQQVPVEKATKIPERKIGDRVAVGFQVVEAVPRARGTDTWTKTYWVDRKTKLPIRIETSFRTTNPRMVETDWVQRDIIFNTELAESLFSTDPPPGYQQSADDAEQKPEQ